jgi:hypothetical protein
MGLTMTGSLRLETRQEFWEGRREEEDFGLKDGGEELRKEGQERCGS